MRSADISGPPAWQDQPSLCPGVDRGTGPRWVLEAHELGLACSAGLAS